MTPKRLVQAAVVQAAPVLFDLDASLDKVERICSEIAEKGADIILFPEAFLPAYPRGLSFGTKVGSRSGSGRDMWFHYWENSVAVPGETVERLAAIAQTAAAFLAIGVMEKEDRGGTLYCSLLYFDSNGIFLGKHRKLKPTAAERVVWGEGDGTTLTTFETEIGRIGGLICWENYMPLARMAMYQQGVELYLAPTADQRDGWQATMQHIALEGRCFVLASNQYVTKDMYPKHIVALESLEAAPDIMSRGGSVIIDPLGNILAGPLFGEEGVLFAELDMHAIPKSKLDFDVIGHYARPDVFEFQVNGMPPVKKV